MNSALASQQKTKTTMTSAKHMAWPQTENENSNGIYKNMACHPPKNENDKDICKTYGLSSQQKKRKRQWHLQKLWLGLANKNEKDNDISKNYGLASQKNNENENEICKNSGLASQKITKAKMEYAKKQKSTPGIRNM